MDRGGKMKEEMFLRPEYVKTLQFLVGLDGCQEVRRVASTDNAFVMRVSRYESGNECLYDVYVLPSGSGIYLLHRLSREYNNIRVVPEAIFKIVEKVKLKKDGWVIQQLPMTVDEVVIENIRSNKNEHGFGFWAVMEIPFDKLSLDLFCKQLHDFVNKSEKVANSIWYAYHKGL